MTRAVFEVKMIKTLKRDFLKYWTFILKKCHFKMQGPMVMTLTCIDRLITIVNGQDAISMNR